jgi:hypothetical protein
MCRSVVVECKLARNSEFRRAAAAQLLSYIAELSRWTYADLERAVRAARKATETDSATGSDSIYALAGASDLDESRFVEVVERNLRRGSMLGLIVADGRLVCQPGCAQAYSQQRQRPGNDGHCRARMAIVNPSTGSSVTSCSTARYSTP